MLYNAGVLAARTGDHEAAEEAYRAAIRARRGAHGLASNGLCALGVDRRMPKESLEDCETAVRLRPKMALAWSNLGRCLGAMGRVRDADAAFARALELEPDNLNVLNHRGSFLHKAQRLTELLEILYRIDAVGPPDASRDATILHVTGIVVGRQLGLERPGKAIEAIERAGERFGNHADLEGLRGLVEAAAGGGSPR